MVDIERAETDDGLVSIELPAVLDFSYCSDLYSELRDHVGIAVTLDGSGVGHVGAPCAQVLLTAARSWQAEGVAFALEKQSEAFSLGFERMGLDASVLSGVSPEAGSSSLAQREGI